MCGYESARGGMAFATENFIDFPMIASGQTIFGSRRLENLDEQDEEISESEPPEHYHSSAPLLGSCSGTMVDVRMKEAGETSKQGISQSEINSLVPQNCTAEPIIESTGFEGSESGFERPEQSVGDKVLGSVEQVHTGASSGLLLTCSSTSGFAVKAHLKDTEGEAARQKDFTRNALNEVKPVDHPQHNTEEPMIGSSSLKGFASGDRPQQFVGEKVSGPLEQIHIGALCGLTCGPSSGFRIRADLEESEGEIASQKDSAENSPTEFETLDRQGDEISEISEISELSGVLSSAVFGFREREDGDSILLHHVYAGGCSGHARNTSSAFGIRTDLEEFEAEIAEQKHEELSHLDQKRDEVLSFSEKSLQEFEPLDHPHDEVIRITGVPSSAVVGFEKRKLGGVVKESSFPDEQVCTKGKPIFGFQTKDKGKRVIEATTWAHVLTPSPLLFNNPEENGGFTVAKRASVGFRAKLQRREPDEGSSSSVEIKAVSLPEELVEKILSMIPFPDILKTCVLSKSWNSNFSTGASVFRNQVKTVSSRWKHYCPVILNIEKELLVGYDREYNRWQNMPLRFEKQGVKNWFSTQKLRGAGSLMCGVFNRSNIFVTNVVTRMWKWLPPRPDMAYPKEIHLLPIGSDFYQVLVITKNERDPTEVSCQLYDSRVETWTIKESTVSTALFNSSSAYLDGVLYVMEYDPDDFRDVMKMLSYDVKEGIWTHIHHPFGSMLHEIETYELLVCQNHVMVVLHLHPTWWTTYKSHKTVRNTLMVYKLDPVSLELREVARGPPEPMSAACTLFASDNDSIYFGNPQVVGSSVIELNLQTKEWSCLPPPTCADGSFKNKWATFPFQPGMNPFVSV